MTYKRNPNVSFTEMCIYIDEHIYQDNFDAEKCYQYMYHIFYTLAVKGRFFNSAKDYDEYALYGATRLFLRYQKRNLNVIKSVLNYVKRILYPTKVEYQAQTFNQVFKQDVEEDVAKSLQDNMTTKAISQNDDMMRVEFEYYLKKIPQTIKEFLKQIPYANDKVLMHNIYISCLLSVLNSFTMSNENKRRIKNKQQRGLSVDNLLESIYHEERKDSTILYNLDNKLYNYISTLVNKIYSIIREDLVYLIGSYEPSDAVIQSILASPIENKMEDMN